MLVPLGPCLFRQGGIRGLSGDLATVEFSLMLVMYILRYVDNMANHKFRY